MVLVVDSPVSLYFKTIRGYYAERKAKQKRQYSLSSPKNINR